MSLEQNKYSRKLKDLDIKNLKTAKITEVNNLNIIIIGEVYLVRENLPFFVMIEIPQVLLGSIFVGKEIFFGRKIIHETLKMIRINVIKLLKKI